MFEIYAGTSLLFFHAINIPVCCDSILVINFLKTIFSPPPGGFECALMCDDDERIFIKKFMNKEFIF